MPARPVVRRLGLVAAAAGLVIALTACDPPLTIATTVSYDCQINTNNPLLGTVTGTIDGSYDATPPQAVKPGGNFNVKVTPKPFTLGPSTSGGTVAQLTTVVWRVAIPAGTTLSSQTI